MNDDISERRRRILQSAGLGGLAALAGCSGLDDSDGNGTENGNSTANGDENSTANGDENGMENGSESNGNDMENRQEGEGRTVGFLTGIDQQQARQLQIQLQQGEISQEEFTTQATELIQSSIDSMTGMLESDTSITIEQETQVTQRFVGAVRVSGDAGELIDAVQSDEVQSIVSEDDFQTLAGAQQG